MIFWRLGVIEYFTALWVIKNEEMANIKKIKDIFNVFLGFWKVYEYTCTFENNFQNNTISSFFISQRAVKSWIIANIHEKLVSLEFVFHFEAGNGSFWGEMVIFANLRHFVQG